MVKSMTGFGKGEYSQNSVTYSVEVKSVNHRYFEFSARVPRGLNFLEERLKTFFAEKISRGKVEVYVGLEGESLSSGKITVNYDFADSYLTALKNLKKHYKLKGKPTLSDIALNQEVFINKRIKLDDEEVWQAVSTAAEQALNSFIKMREAEGKRLAEDVENRCDTILEKVAFVEQRSPETVENYRNRLQEKMIELLGDKQVDEQRLLSETAIFADKIAVDEETVRLKSHIAQLKEMLLGNGAVGRKLDFVVQEMNREANTIGSKAQNIEIAHTVVDIKSEIEKIREQIQNIE